MASGGKLPPLPPITPPTPIDKSALVAQLQAQGRRSGLRAALMTRMGIGQSTGAGKRKLGE